MVQGFCCSLSRLRPPFPELCGCLKRGTLDDSGDVCRVFRKIVLSIGRMSEREGIRPCNQIQLAPTGLSTRSATAVISIFFSLSFVASFDPKPCTLAAKLSC